MSERLMAVYEPSNKDREKLVEAKRRTISKHKKIIERLEEEVDAL